MVKEEGFLALYKGLVPAVMQTGPQMGLQFGFYSLFQGVWRQFFEIEKHAKPGMPHFFKIFSNKSKFLNG